MTRMLRSTEGAFLMINSMMGSGIVFQDKVFKNAGLLYAIVIYIISAFLTAFSQIFLCNSAKCQKRDNISYSDITYIANYFLGLATEIIIFIFLFLVSVFYGAKLKSLLNELYIFPPFLINFIIAFSIIIVTLFISISILKYTSKLSILGVIVIISSAFIYFFNNPVENFKNIELIGDNKLNALKMALFGMCCQFNTLNIYNNLEDRSNMGIFKFAFLNSFGGVLLSALVGLFSAGAFKADANTDICTYLLMNTNKYSYSIAIISSLAFATVLFTGIISIIFSLCNIVEEFNKTRTKLVVDRIFINFGVSLIVVGCSLYYDPGKLLDIIADSFISLISLIFPTISYLLIIKKGQLGMKILATMMLVLGIGIMIYYNYKNFYGKV